MSPKLTQTVRETAPAPSTRTIPVFAFGAALSLFLAISYLFCIALYFWSPAMVENHAILALFRPGVKLLSWQTFFLGLIESFGYGWYITLIFGPIYNLFVTVWP